MPHTIVITKEAGRRVTELRERKGWTQAVLAAKVGVTTPQICRIEGGANTRRPTFAALLVALGCEARDILGADLPEDADALRAEIRARVEQLEEDKLPSLLAMMLQLGFEQAA